MELGEKLKRKAGLGFKMLLNHDKNLVPYLGNVELLDKKKKIGIGLNRHFF